MIDKVKERCTGCKLCADVCHASAVSFSENEDGFWYPIVDYEKCTMCRQCLDMCPIESPLVTTKCMPIVYAGWIKNNEIRIKSTSGGIYYALAEAFVKSENYIVGCAYCSGYKSAKHVVANDERGLVAIMGSKYFQSDTENIFKLTKEILDHGKKVLFCGTPCQCVAMQKYAENYKENLTVVDFICRGVNSPKAFKAYMEEIEGKYHSDIQFVNLKNKKTGWESLATYIKLKNGQEYHKDREQDWWIKGFIKGNLYMRQSCHHCEFKTLPRFSDITIGDFWGIDKASEEDKFKGISLIMCNSFKGLNLLKHIESEVVLEKKALSLAVKGNPCILHSATEGKNRSDFFKLINEMVFSEAVKKCFENFK
ncbi:Coenzyme F420 hydrogenase/dehydrogenase, beta subunit C-terminal domain [Aminipila luticellarii]|uniref:4Fe-4S dicluster domain-containing protein n=1 Tax=Aminipila luticellarii TaxID=2507160 RepID=A0A410PSS1_9FIRM|nr:Coenzyme F420 hydrogenase/dehydrogenase, beta subunit C-terminal domain [Aminipila luticellarii]QAT42012.1 4Fe-4S dicluster domain-containing protein [Aminipila luticellarii]